MFQKEINQKEIKFDTFEVEDLGVTEEWVYYIEVEDNHNFFANDVLVHNSIYINMEPLIETVFGTSDIDKDVGEKFLDNVCKDKIEKVIDKS